MVKFVYVDETGTDGRSDEVIVVAAVVPEEQVGPLAAALREIRNRHTADQWPDWPPSEFHGHEMFHGTGQWNGVPVENRIAAYTDAMGLIPALGIELAHASINTKALRDRWNGRYDDNAYLLALQFLLEKINSELAGLKVVVADEKHDHRLRAIGMVSGLQRSNVGIVAGRPLTNIIDTLHFVRSSDSPGVQLADLVAFALQRRRRGSERDPRAEAAMARIMEPVFWNTYRMTWPT